MKKIKLGFAPTRRSIFSAPDAVKYRGLTAERLKELPPVSSRCFIQRVLQDFLALSLSDC